MKAVMRYYLRISLLFAILLSGIVYGEVIKTSNGAGADTYINYWSSSTNYGAQSDLKISKNYIPYVKFDLGIVGPNNISDANLTFYGTPDPNNPPTVTPNFNVYGLIDGSDSWGEGTITYKNAPLVTNPIVKHPSLVLIGTLNYTPAGNEGPITMDKNASGVPAGAFINFLNDRGPDNLVTIIIASGSYDVYSYFSTKEDHGDATEAPLLSVISVSPTVVERNNWTGTDSNSWSDPDNWLDESNSTSVPDGNAVVNLVSGSHYPVIIDSNSYAKKVFVQDGNLSILSGTLTITGGVLRVKDGLKVNIVDGQIVLSGNVEGQMWGLIGKGKIITTKLCQQEVYAQYNSNSVQTIVGTRDIVRKLSWGNSIVSADGPLGYESGGYPAQYCVDGSGMLAEAHMGYVEGNGYYCKTLWWDEPTLKFVFDANYNLTDMYVWNYEDTYKGYGLKNVQIEYSTNDTAYTTLLSFDANDANDTNDPNLFTFLPGRQDCAKDDIIPFGGIPVKYLKLTARGGPGTGSYEYGSSWGRYILRELQFCHEGMEASNPNPANNTTYVDVKIGSLRWIPGKKAITGQDVWFGTDPNAMTKIGNNISPCTDTISISTLQSDRDYYWRVDANDGSGPITGRLWHFKTKKWLPWNPGGEGIIFAFGVKTYGGTKGYLAADGSGITGDIDANYSSSNSWYCKQPWLYGVNEPQLYIEFDKIYDINEMWIWNREGTATEALKTVRIEYSADGVNYNILMNGSEPNFVLPHGNTDGTHDTEIEFGVPAKYVKLTAIGGIGVGNYGSTNGYQLREVRFYADGPYTSVNAYAPAPAEDAEVDIFTEFGWTPGTNAGTGQDIWLGKVGESLVKIASNIAPDVNSYTLPQLDNLSDYKWRIDSRDGNSVTQGDEWHFSTRARLRWNLGLIGVADANGSPGDGGSQGYNAANWSGLYYDYHYSSTDTSVPGYSWTTNAWYCRKPWNVGITEPNLLIKFDRIYDINEMWVWNHDGIDGNLVDPAKYDEYQIALKTIKIEYSTNGINYTTLMNGSEPNFVLPHGHPDGTHDTEIGFKDLPAKYVRITAVGGPGVGNYGSANYGYKLREVRFYYQVPLWADLNNDKKVNFKDYAIMAEDWLDENWIYVPTQYCLNKPAGDITGDCKVDYLDIEVLAGEWLEDIN
jgi:hypothetical protein